MLKEKQAGKNILYFLPYMAAGLMGCLLAFFLSLQFLSPVFSENVSETTPASKNQLQKNEKPSDSALKNIKKMGVELKNLLSNNSDQEKKAPKPSAHTEIKNNTPQPPQQLKGFEKPKPVEISIEDKGNAGIKKGIPPSGEVNAPPVAGQGAAPAQAEVPPSGEVNAPPVAGQGAAPAQAEVPPSGEVNAPPVAGQGAAPAQAEVPPSGEVNAPPVAGQGAAPAQAEVPPSGEGNVPPVAGQGAAPAQAEAPISGSLLQLKSYMEPFIYDPTTKRRNPFDDPTQEKVDGASGTKKTRKGIVKPPTELYPLKDIELKGIIWDVESPKALFQLPENQGFYTLLQGDRLGKYGVIEEISEDKVKISETIVKGDGVDQQTEKRKTIKRINRLKF